MMLSEIKNRNPRTKTLYMEGKTSIYSEEVDYWLISDVSQEDIENN